MSFCKTLPTVLLFVLLSKILAGNLLLNAGGPALPCEGFRADTGSWASTPSTKYSTASSASGWDGVYPTHRWVRSGDLLYNLPVPTGKYKVYLMFAETWRQAREGTPQFHVLINDKRVSQAGGSNHSMYTLEWATENFFSSMHGSMNQLIIKSQFDLLELWERITR